MDKPDIHRLLGLQTLLLQFSQIERVIDRKTADGTFTRETDTEHSYNLAISAWFLCQYFPELNRDTVIRYALVHDMVEVHAGDTYVYGPQEHLDSKHAREQAALQRLQADWPDFTDMTARIKDYERRDTAEARFVYAIDKIMPAMQIYLNDGYTWKQQGIKLNRLDENKRQKVAISPEIADYYDQLYKLLMQNQQLFG